MIFIKAQTGPSNVGDPKAKFTVHYFDEDGNLTIRSGGTRAWRCNNPGNLRRSHYTMSKKRRAIGFAGDDKDAYAVYPNKETGREALTVMLQGSVYSPKTLRSALAYYEPHKKDYIDIVVDRTGLDPERTIRSLDDKEFMSFWQAIELVEKWEVGREDFIERWIISGVHKKRGIIFEYCIRKPIGCIWIEKTGGIALANEGRLHATMVHLQNGVSYLRPEYRAKPFQVVT